MSLSNEAGLIRPKLNGMVQVHWLEQAEAEIPARNDWLTATESVRLNGFRFAKRRTDWLLGRWTAKLAVAIRLSLPLQADSLANLEIRQAPSGAPEALIANQPASVVISLSHRAGRAICAVGPAGSALGCDLESVEPRTDAFVADYLAPQERALVARLSEADRSRVATLLWSCKESALKALGTGLRLDTRSVIVSLGEPRPNQEQASAAPDGSGPIGDERAGITGEWRPFWVRHTTGQVFHGWWQQTGMLLRTTVTAPPSDRPILLIFSRELGQRAT